MYYYDPAGYRKEYEPGDRVEGLCPRCGAERLVAAKRDGEQGLQRVCKLCGWRQPM